MKKRTLICAVVLLSFAPPAFAAGSFLDDHPIYMGEGAASPESHLCYIDEALAETSGRHVDTSSDRRSSGGNPGQAGAASLN